MSRTDDLTHDIDKRYKPYFVLLHYEASGNPEGIFQIDESTGHINLAKDFPDERMQRIQLPVTLNDDVNLPNTRNVTIDILGINRPPRIEGCTGLNPVLKEGQPVGTKVITVSYTCIIIRV